MCLEEWKEARVYQRERGRGKTEGNGVREVTVGRRDLVAKVRSLGVTLSVTESHWFGVSHSSAHFNSLADLPVPENSNPFPSSVSLLTPLPPLGIFSPPFAFLAPCLSGFTPTSPPQALSGHRF